MSKYLNREVTGKFSRKELEHLRQCFDVVTRRHSITGVAKEQAWLATMTSPRKALVSLSALAAVPHFGEDSLSEVPLRGVRCCTSFSSS